MKFLNTFFYKVLKLTGWVSLDFIILPLNFLGSTRALTVYLKGKLVNKWQNTGCLRNTVTCFFTSKSIDSKYTIVALAND